MVKYKIVIEPVDCSSDRACCEIAPATFDMDDNGKIFVVDPAGDPPEDILEAAQCCRLGGIILYDAGSGDLVWPKD